MVAERHPHRLRPGAPAGTASVTVLDDDTPSLRVFLDPATIEEGGVVTGRVERNWITAAPLAVTLSASASGQVNLHVVVIGANQASAAFTLTTIQDTLPEKDDTLTITAEAGGFAGGRHRSFSPITRTCRR